MRKILFSEKYGRNIIWLMLSGFFLKLGAKENYLGEIIIPEDNYLFNLDETHLDENYLNYNKLHFVILDGAVQHLNDQRLKKIKKETKIYYVGKFDNYWGKIENSELLYSNNCNDQREILNKIKCKFPFFFKKYLLKKFFTSFSGIKNLKLLSNHLGISDKYVYYGYIKPTSDHLNKFKNILKFDEKDINKFFYKQSSFNEVKKQIKELCNLKDNLMSKLSLKDYPYLNELLLFLIRNILCNFLKGKKNFLIYDGKGGNSNFNAYEMFFGNKHTYLDFGSKVGYDYLYPRSALLELSKRKTVRFYCEEIFFNLNESEASLYLEERADSFFRKLSI
tara:strand:- start:5620 stop:6624 length:1005 start_codon:yes stop_codon:yes gene_type:complete